ncbi:Ig-like domain-containing protein, partial [Xenorhabdus sp. PR6a]|uniref:Ig-like domain-containing protein n=1 Tax=Xenorhabdus sp. PR6a TaxID=3025877 RepID=UPI0023592910
SSGDTTDGDGKLTATLASTMEIKDIAVSLAIGSHKPVQAKAVDFKPEQISAIDVKPTSPLLVNKISTLTVRVNDATGKNPEINKTVNWTIKSADHNGVKLNPTSSTTNAQGYATTTLTSDQAKTVTVEAAVEGIATKKSVDVEFKWPTIQKPTFTPTTGTVPPDADKNSQDAYHYTAAVHGTDGKPYTEKEIKFKWQLKPVAQGNVQDTWLSETGEMTVKPDGTLQVDLMSKQKSPVVKGAIVCLAVVDQNSVAISETEQCADSVDFKPESVKIVSLKPTNFNPNTLQKGDGNASYTYTAEVVRADGTPLPDGHKVENVKWDFDPKPNTYNGNPEWEIKSDNIVKNGQLTATLTSQVGIGDINNGQVTDGLKVILSAPDGGKTSSAVAGPVVFKVVSQPAGVVVYVKEADNTTIKKSKIFKDQLRPSNSFGNMYAKLHDLSIDVNILANGGEIISPKGFDNELIIDLPTGEIYVGLALRNQHDTSVTVKRPNKAKYTYNYSFWIKKLIMPNTVHTGVMKQDSQPEDVSCKNSGIPYLRNIDEVDVGISKNDSYSLQNEFPDSYSWGLLDAVSPQPPVTPNILGEYGPNSTSAGNFIYNTQENKQVNTGNDLQGYVICVGSYLTN